MWYWKGKINNASEYSSQRQTIEKFNLHFVVIKWEKWEKSDHSGLERKRHKTWMAKKNYKMKSDSELDKIKHCLSVPILTALHQVKTLT